MSITGIEPTSTLNDLYASGQIGNKSTTTSLFPDGNGQTISEIRDQVDKLALSGKLTSLQQIGLIAAGFQDLNAEDPSYQPAGQTGYTRATVGTFDLSGSLKAIGEFDSAHRNFTDAVKFASLSDLFARANGSTHLDIKA